MKKYWLLLLLLLGTKFMGLKLVEASIMEQFCDITGLIIIFFSLLKKSQHNYNKKLVKYYSLFFFTILLSIFTCFFIWHQNIFTSLIAIRSIYWGLLFFYLIKNNINLDTIIKSLKYYTIIYLIIWVIQLVIFPTIILQSGINEYDYEKYNTLHFGVPGILLVIFYGFLYFFSRPNTYNLRTIFVFIAITSIVFITNTRGIIFPFIASLILGIFLSSNHKRKFLLISLFSIILLVFASNTLIKLVNETHEQFSNSDYNRFKSIEFIFNNNKNIATILFGNGFGSSHSAYGLFINSLKQEGIYLSDLGILGHWFIFGLINVAILFYILIFALKTSKFLPIKLFSLYLILSPTILFLLNRDQIIVFSILIYFLISYEKNLNFSSHYKL